MRTSSASSRRASAASCRRRTSTARRRSARPGGASRRARRPRRTRRAEESRLTRTGRRKLATILRRQHAHPLNNAREDSRVASRLRTILCGLATIAALSTAGVTGTAAATTGLVAAYSFDSNSTSVLDASGNGNNGAATNATWVAGGTYGGAWSFDGATSLVSVPDSLSLHMTGGYTVEAWVDPA